MTETNPIAYPIEEIPAVVGVPRTKIFQAIRERRLTARKVGRSTIITHDDLMAWLNSLPTKGKAETQAA
jgi:excisionase family DNA binding protein